MNNFEMSTIERRKAGAERTTNREDVEAELRGMTEPIDTKKELADVGAKLADVTKLTREETYHLQVRRAALLEYERGRELPRHKVSSKVEDAQDIPTLSPELEEKYPIFGARLVKKSAGKKYVHEDLHDGRTIPIIKQREIRDDQDAAAT